MERVLLMSGFSYYLSCPKCKMISLTYPFLFQYTFSNVLVLPVANTLTREFEEIEVITNDHKINDYQLKEITKQYTKETYYVCFPRFSYSDERIELKPRMTCPRCGYISVKSILGCSPVDTIYAKTEDEIVQKAHSEENIKFNFNNAVLIQIYPNKEKNRTCYLWSFRIEDKKQEYRGLVTVICKKLESMGSEISNVYEKENYISFYELAGNTT